eukprot:3099568-Amphidinium_carterae.3
MERSSSARLRPPGLQLHTVGPRCTASPTLPTGCHTWGLVPVSGESGEVDSVVEQGTGVGVVEYLLEEGVHAARMYQVSYQHYNCLLFVGQKYPNPGTYRTGARPARTRDTPNSGIYIDNWRVLNPLGAKPDFKFLKWLQCSVAEKMEKYIKAPIDGMQETLDPSKRAKAEGC